jgi:thioredoxin-dependent peroxiredoxin
MVKAGDIAPDFTLPTHEGKSLALSSLRGRKVFLWFYPAADTPGCTTEGCSLRDHQDYFDENNVEVLGASFDTIDANAAFAQKHGFKFPLLSDLDRNVAMAYGACSDPKSAWADRVSFLIDENGRIERVYVQVNPRDHAANVLADILGV